MFDWLLTLDEWVCVHRTCTSSLTMHWLLLGLKRIFKLKYFFLFVCFSVSCFYFTLLQSIPFSMFIFLIFVALILLFNFLTFLCDILFFNPFLFPLIIFSMIRHSPFFLFLLFLLSLSLSASLCLSLYWNRFLRVSQKLSLSKTLSLFFSLSLFHPHTHTFHELLCNSIGA